jgi:hypothetical protein
VVKFFLLTSALLVGLFNNPVFATTEGTNVSYLANFERESASEDARQIADWVLHSRDNQSMPFLIIDKQSAKVFVFDPVGQIMGASAVLLGLAVGDDSSRGVGQRKLSSIPVAERTTPAGRFVGSLSNNLSGKGVLWIDYDAAISLHRVITSNVEQQRAQRLESSTITDNRISFGCINVPAGFYDQLIEKTFQKTNAVIYVLPEIRSIQETFGSYVVNENTSITESATHGEGYVNKSRKNVIQLR